MSNASLTADLLRKTRQCAYFGQGRCFRGATCSFAHGADDVIAAPDFSYTQSCIAFLTTGECDQGAICKFAHAVDQLRPWWKTEVRHVRDGGSSTVLMGRTRTRRGTRGRRRSTLLVDAVEMSAEADTSEQVLATYDQAEAGAEVEENGEEMMVVVKNTFLELVPAKLQDGEAVGKRRSHSVPPTTS